MSRDNLATILPLGSDSDTNFKDGGDGEVELTRIEIDFAVNGFCVTFIFVDGEVIKEIHESMEQVLKAIQQTF